MRRPRTHWRVIEPFKKGSSVRCHSPGTRVSVERRSASSCGSSDQSAPRSGSLEGRCGRAGVDLGRADRRRLFVPHQDRREHSGNDACCKAFEQALERKRREFPPVHETAQRRTGGSHHRPASGAAPEGLRELVVALAGAAGRRVGDHRVDQPRNHPADAKKNGMTQRKIEYWVIPPQADAEFRGATWNRLRPCTRRDNPTIRRVPS